MTTIEIIAGVGGVGGVLAFLIFLSYRYLVSQLQQDKKASEERLTGIIKAYNEVCQDNAKATQENALAIRELYMYLKNKNGH